MDVKCALPEEIWRQIFSYLSDFQLLQSVVPVCHLFRDLAYSVGFRRCGVEGITNLGNQWLLWHNFSPEFLRRITTPKCIEFKLSKETLEYLKEPDAKFDIGLGRIEKNEDEDSPYFNVEQSVEERSKMVEMLQAFPELKDLRVHHKSYERHSDHQPSHSRRVSPRTPHTDCPTSTAEFLRQMLNPVQNSIEQLHVNLSCVCPRVSERRRGPDVSGEVL